MTLADKRALVADGLFTVEQAAEFSTLHPRTIYALLAEHSLIGVRVGRRWMVPKTALVDYLAARVVLQ